MPYSYWANESLHELRWWIKQRLCTFGDVAQDEQLKLPERQLVKRFFMLAPRQDDDQCKILANKNLELRKDGIKIGYFGYRVGSPDVVVRVHDKTILIECKCLREPNNGCEVRNAILQLQEYFEIYRSDYYALVVFSWLKSTAIDCARNFIREGRNLAYNVYRGNGGSKVDFELIWVDLASKQLL